MLIQKTALGCVDLKIMHNMSIKFYLGQYEDCSLGDSTSDSSAKLFQRGSGERRYICDFGEGGVHAIEHIFFAESLCWSHEASACHKKVVTTKHFSALLDMRRYKNWAHKISS